MIAPQFGRGEATGLTKVLAAAALVPVPVFVGTAWAETVSLTCFSENSLDVKRNVTTPWFGRFSAQIKFSDERVTGIVTGQAHWCNLSGAFVTGEEIGFPCSFNLAGQRISYSFTLDRFSGTFEQRFFIGGKLRQVHYGRCSLK
jgi:hypothetical protein